MTEQLTPPPELVQEWRKSGPADAAANNAYEQHIATQAARWGADQELEACCDSLQELWAPSDWITSLRAKRRPKPPGLKEQALALLEPQGTPARLFNEDQMGVIRRALEQLPND